MKNRLQNPNHFIMVTKNIINRHQKKFITGADPADGVIFFKRKVKILSITFSVQYIYGNTVISAGINRRFNTKIKRMGKRQQKRGSYNAPQYFFPMIIN